MNLTGIEELLGRLSGEPVPFPERLRDALSAMEFSGIGHSQLNELLLLAGLDRVTHAFFAYLATNTTECEVGTSIRSMEALQAGVDRFRQSALLVFGNVKYAFKRLSRNADLLGDHVASFAEIGADSFERRHEPLLPLTTIAPDEAYLTGYLIERQLQDRLASNPEDKSARKDELRRQEIVKLALQNQAAYLASDHLDVYVATSMRERHEFISISRCVREIFENEAIKPLKLRWFDPTQAYCDNRIDKGLAEALMLKRASCTIYLAQESDTLGKDSELASTLAQGKPVIAFIPEVDDQFLAMHLAVLKEAEPGKTEKHLLLEQLRLFEPNAAWVDSSVRAWCENPEAADIAELKRRLESRIRQHYDSRAGTLMESHPLGIQVNLSTGVANGVLVVRTADACARIVRGIVTRTLHFDLEEGDDSTVLRESISGCIFRVMTKDAMLTNTFWNFYLDPAE